MRSELIDSVNVIVVFVIGTREKADSAFNQVKLIAVGVQFGGVKNGMSEIVNKIVIGVMGFGAVDDDSLQIFVPALRLAEKFAKSAFAVDRIDSEAVDEFFGNVFVNVVGIDVAEVIIDSRPDVVASEIFEIVHRKYLRK